MHAPPPPPRVQLAADQGCRSQVHARGHPRFPPLPPPPDLSGWGCIQPWLLRVAWEGAGTASRGYSCRDPSPAPPTI